MAEAGISGLTMATSAQSEPKMSQERLQENRNVAFVAATHFPGFGADMSHPQDDKTISDNDRGTDALENLEDLLKQGFQMTIVNSSDKDNFYQKLLILQDQYSNLSVSLEEKEGKYSGLTGAKRRGLEIASHTSEVKIIGEFELEKKLSPEDIDKCLAPLRGKKAQLVIPNRGELEGYPPTQRALEQKTNLELNEAAQRAGLLRDPEDPHQDENVPEKLDWCGGFRFFVNDPEVVQLFSTQYAVQGELAKRKVFDEHGQEESIDPKKWYDTLYGPVVEMLYSWAVYRKSPIKSLLGSEPVVMSVPIHYVHHKSNVEEGSDYFNRKRERQFGQIVEIAKRHIYQLDIVDCVQRVTPGVSILCAASFMSAGEFSSGKPLEVIAMR